MCAGQRRDDRENAVLRQLDIKSQCHGGKDTSLAGLLTMVSSTADSTSPRVWKRLEIKYLHREIATESLQLEQ